MQAQGRLRVGWPSNEREVRVKKTLAVAVIVVALLGVLAVTPGIAGATVKLTKIERAVMDAVNAERTARGLPALRCSASLTRAARDHARSMAHNAFFSHTGLNGDSVAERVRRHGYGSAGCRVWMVGETLAKATVGAQTPDAEQIVSGWMQSSPHRRVILTRSLRDAGVGVRAGGGWRYYTLDLGRRAR
jgi:uncharacterized protein YkwD